MNNLKVTDNVELDFPARMSDDGVFTDYGQNCILNNSISKQMGSWEYRNYLTNNASQIHQNMLSSIEAKVKCGKCSDVCSTSKNNIELFTRSCTYQMNDPNGLGQGRV